MKLKFITIGVFIACFSCNAQENQTSKYCYQNVWAKWIENELPESICIKEDEMIYGLFKKFDFNIDGMQDLAIEKGGDELVNGLQTELVVYQKVNDSTFIKFRELDNVYPLWFEDYDPSVKIGDPKIDTVKEYYEGNPLRRIELVDNIIVLNLNGDVVTEYILTYTYSNEKEDWFLTDYVEYDLHNNVKKPYPSDNIGTSISEFSYVEFMNGEY
ncbi:MAG: hypothetical protein Tsb004_23410 [Allomuricauda sp.]